MAEVTVIGGGLAGCEAAWQLAEAGFSVRLLEMKPVQYTPAHHYEGLAELVCSNSLKADRLNSAAGLLKAEMTRLGSLLMQCARKSAVAAGGALAVDRKQFSDLATEAIRNHPNITLETAVVTEIPDTPTVVATGPLTEGALAADIEKRCGTRLSFFDAAAPIVSFESLDKEKVFFAARYGRGDADYINCPMNKAEYEEFYQALIGAERAPLHDCDKDAFRVYEGCMPIEVLASRGMDTMRFGPLKPVGLTVVSFMPNSGSPDKSFAYGSANTSPSAIYRYSYSKRGISVILKAKTSPLLYLLSTGILYTGSSLPCSNKSNVISSLSEITEKSYPL